MATASSRSRRSAKAAPSVDPSRIVVIAWPDEPPAIVHVAASPALAQAWCEGFNARDTEFFQAAEGGTARTAAEVAGDPTAHGILTAKGGAK